MNFCQHHTLSITELFLEWEVYARLEEIWREKLEANPENDHAATRFAFWNVRRKLVNAEIERRADLLEISVVNQLIETCSNFVYHDNSRV